MKKENVSNITIENARIGFRNFTGKEGKFNPEGNRNFAVFLENDVAEMLLRDGWNVRWLKPKDPEEPPQGMIQVKVGFGNYPPKIVLINGTKKSELSEETVSLLDWCEIHSVDLIIRPYSWAVSGKEGVKAYLKTMYVTLEADVLKDKYERAPDSALDVIGGCGNCAGGICAGDCEKKAEHI